MDRFSVSDAKVTAESDPSPTGCFAEPDDVGASRWEVIGMPLNANTGIPQDRRKPQTEISIGEEDNIQAARS